MTEWERMLTCAGDYSTDQGWVKLRSRFSNSIGEAMVLKVWPLPLRTKSCWTFWALHIFPCTVRLTFLLEIPLRSQRDCSWGWNGLLKRLSFSELIICYKKFLELKNSHLGLARGIPTEHYSSLQSKADFQLWHHFRNWSYSCREEEIFSFYKVSFNLFLVHACFIHIQCIYIFYICILYICINTQSPHWA